MPEDGHENKMGDLDQADQADLQGLSPVEVNTCRADTGDGDGGDIHPLQNHFHKSIDGVASHSLLKQMENFVNQMSGNDYKEKLSAAEAAVFGPGVAPFRDILLRYFASSKCDGPLDNEKLSYLDIELQYPDMWIISVDLGAFAMFDDNSTASQKIQVQKALEEVSIYAEREFGVFPLKARAGDCYVWGLLKDGCNNSDLIAVVSKILKKVESIEMPVHAIKDACSEKGESLYKCNQDKCYFKGTAVVVDAPEGSVKATLHTGDFRSGQGHVRLRGEAFAKVLDIENAKPGVTKGRIKVCSSLVNALGDFVEIDDNSEFSPTEVDPFNVDRRGPFSYSEVDYADDVRVYALAAAAQASVQDGALSRYLNRNECVDGLSAEPGLICIGFQVGSAKDEVKDPEKYKRFYAEYYKCISEDKFASRFEVLKQDEGWMIVSSRKNAQRLDLKVEADVRLLIDYLLMLASLLKKNNLPVRIAAAGAHTRFSIPEHDRVAEEFIWGDVVTAARLVKGMPEDMVCIHSSVCLRASGSLALQEMMKHIFKGIGVVQFLALKPDSLSDEEVHKRIMAQDLFGVDALLKRLLVYVNQAENYGSIALLPPESDPKGKGYGSSALARRLVESLKEDESQLKGRLILPLRGSILRRILSLYLADYNEQWPDVEIIYKYRTLIAENIEIFDGDLLVIDPMGPLPEIEYNILKETKESFKGRKSLMLWVNGEGDVKEHLSHMRIKDAARLLLQMHGLDHTNNTLREMVGVRLRSLNIKLKVRFVIHVLAKSMRILRQGESIIRIDFDVDNLRNVREPGELAALAEELHLSSVARWLYGLIAKIALPVSFNSLHMCVSRINMTLSIQRLREELDRLIDIGWLNCDGDKYCLADMQQREAAIALHSFDYGVIPNLLISTGGIIPLNSECLPSDFKYQVFAYEHLLAVTGGITDESKYECMRILAAQIAEEYFLQGRLTDARRVFWDYIESVDAMRGVYFSEKLDLSEQDFYLKIVQIMLQSEEMKDHDLAEKICSALISNSKVSTIYKARAFAFLSRIVARGRFNPDGKQHTRYAVTARHLPIQFKDFLSESKYHRAYNLCNELGAHEALFNLMKDFPHSLEREESLSWDLVYHMLFLVKTFISFELLQYVVPNTAGRFPFNKNKLLEDFTVINNFLTRNIDEIRKFDIYREIIPTFFRLMAGCFSHLKKIEKTKEYFFLAQNAYERAPLPDYKQIHDAMFGILWLDFKNFYEECRGINKESNTDTYELQFQVIMSGALNLKKSCIEKGDLRNWKKSLIVMANCCEIYLQYVCQYFSVDKILQKANSFYRFGQSVLEEQRNVMIRAGEDPERVDRLITSAMRDMDKAYNAVKTQE